jgi:hypothetical protein
MKESKSKIMRDIEPVARNMHEVMDDISEGELRRILKALLESWLQIKVIVIITMILVIFVLIRI